jgi:hypothetical protein
LLEHIQRDINNMYRRTMYGRIGDLNGRTGGFNGNNKSSNEYNKDPNKTSGGNVRDSRNGRYYKTIDYSTYRNLLDHLVTLWSLLYRLIIIRE